MSDIQSDLVTMGVFVVRYLVGACLRCRRACSSPDTETVTRACHIPRRVLQDGDPVPRPIVLETWARGSQKKAWIQYEGETIVDHPSPFDFNYRTPWFWIGYKTISGDLIDLTSDMSQYVVPGNHIKPELIHTMFPRSETGALVYIDPKTFEIKDLSSDGLVIGDGMPSTPPASPELVPDCGRVCASSVTDGTIGVD